MEAHQHRGGSQEERAQSCQIKGFCASLFYTALTVSISIFFQIKAGQLLTADEQALIKDALEARVNFLDLFRSFSLQI